MNDKDTSVKVAVRIRPLNSIELASDSSICVDVIPGEPRVVAGSDMYFTFDYAFGIESEQQDIYAECVSELVNSTFEGFNATILAYGQTGSGKTWTMGSSSDLGTTQHSQGIIPRVIRHIFHVIEEKELQNSNTSYKVQVSFLEIYGEDIRDLLDQTRTSKVSIREAPNGDVFVAGAREEVVSSVQQMMKTLEDGTKNRTTASTRMNLSSSRSHVMIEQTIHVGTITSDSTEPTVVDAEDESSKTSPKLEMKQEVRKCKFHFVDLAGSERLKRTGAQGQQMKEGIDINKGLLALGNVISALGDETKRGKVHVPYRDSKLTRILQDSLGGNSKTLMICCVSPAYSNFFESVNALRYANRARNIKNKPVVNRDPTLVIIDELRQVNRLLASEIVTATKENGYIPKEPKLTIDFLISMIGGNNASMTSLSPIQSQIKRINSLVSNNKSLAFHAENGGISESSNGNIDGIIKGDISKVPPRNRLQEKELKKQVDMAEEEIHRMTAIIRQSHLQIQELSDRLAFTLGERDFFRMKWMDSNPDTMSIDDMSAMSGPSSRKSSRASDFSHTENIAPIASGVSPSYVKRELKKERDKTVDMIAKYVREIEELKRDLNRKQNVSSPLKKKTVSPLLLTASENVGSSLINQDYDSLDNEDMPDVDPDWTASIARAIAQAKDFIKLESKKLLKTTIAKGSANTQSASDGTTDETKGEDVVEEDFDDGEDDDADDAEANELKFKRRQDDLKAEVLELTESIQVKENLVKQLEKSQTQYSAMKTFYENKLEALSAEMSKKHSEREQLLKELNELETKKNITLASKTEKETSLREELKRRDEELRTLKKKQEELNRLSKIQSRYLEQLSKLESDIDAMKRHRVELTKTLEREKKQHLTDLKEKAKEIDYLKRQLAKRAEEISRLGNEKEKAVNRAKEMMRESSEMRRRANDFYKLTNGKVSGGNSTTGVNSAGTTTTSSATDKKSLMKSAPLLSKRMLSPAELKTKKWLEKQIVLINAREEAAEALRRQCEQQMSLIKERESLESMKEKLMTQSISSIVNGSMTNPKMDAMATLLGKSADQESLNEIEDRIAVVDSQLKLRTRQISDIREKLNSETKNEDGLGDQVQGAVESLKQTAASSLPAAHELIRLLFDMLVDSRRQTISAQTSADDGLKRESKLKDDIAKLEREIQSLKHSRDVDLMRVAKEYEEKLQGLFDHSSVGQMLLQEGLTQAQTGASLKMDDNELQESLRQAVVSPNSKGDSAKKSENNMNNESQLRALISVSLQRVESLRNQVTHERNRSEELEANISSLDQYRIQLLRLLDDRDANIKFLEEERNFFKDMVYEYRGHVEKLGGKTGKRIISQIRNQAKSKKEYSLGGNELVLGLSDDEDDGNALTPLGGSNVPENDMNDFDTNEDSKYIMDQFELIDNEIKNSKSIQIKGDVVARLTNPTNFTGVHKKVFEEDISTKRKKVQEMKNHVGNSLPAFNAASASGIVPITTHRPTGKKITFSQHHGNESMALSPADLMGLTATASNQSLGGKDTTSMLPSPPKRNSGTGLPSDNMPKSSSSRSMGSTGSNQSGASSQPFRRPSTEPSFPSNQSTSLPPSAKPTNAFNSRSLRPLVNDHVDDRDTSSVASHDISLEENSSMDIGPDDTMYVRQ